MASSRRVTSKLRFYDGTIFPFLLYNSLSVILGLLLGIKRRFLFILLHSLPNFCYHTIRLLSKERTLLVLSLENLRDYAAYLREETCGHRPEVSGQTQRESRS